VTVGRGVHDWVTKEGRKTREKYVISRGGEKRITRSSTRER
jgi:hypothetical protein